MMRIKRLFWLAITCILGAISILYMLKLDYNPDSYIITIDNNKKTDFKIVYTPFRWIDVDSFIDVSSKSEKCSNYLEKGDIVFQYEYKGKTYIVNQYSSFAIDQKFDNTEPIKIILESKRNLGQCKFHIFPYPGKINIILNGIIFFWLPLLLIYVNIVLPIAKYLRKKRKT
jgi:hypothetical protein